MSATDSGRHALIIFDGDCPFCGALVDLVRRHNARGSFQFAARQSDAGRQILTRLGVVPDELASVAVVIDQEIYTQSEAVLRIVSQMNFPWNSLRILGLVPRRLRDLGYALIARNRHRLSAGCTTCRTDGSRDDAGFLP